MPSRWSLWSLRSLLFTSTPPHRQTIHLIFGPTIFDRRVLAFDKAGFLQALTKAAQTVRNPLKRSGIEKSDPQESLTVARLRTAAT